MTIGGSVKEKIVATTSLNRRFEYCYHLQKLIMLSHPLIIDTMIARIVNDINPIRKVHLRLLFVSLFQ